MKKKVFNSKFELIIVVMNYLKNNYNFNKDEISSIIKLHIDNNCSIDEEKYRTLLNEIDWINLNLEYYIFEFNIDIEKVINNSKREFLVLDNLFIENIVIYIESKCSLSNKEKIKFFISEKELEFINGELEGKDKEHCFIYYVYNVNQIDNSASIEIIDYEKFNTLQKRATNYFVFQE